MTTYEDNKSVLRATIRGIPSYPLKTGPRRPRPPQPHPKRDVVAQLRREGLSCGEIAGILGMTKRNVQKHWAKADGRWRPVVGQGQPRKQRFPRELLWQMVQAGVKQSEIARRFGVTRQAIWEALEHEGVER